MSAAKKPFNRFTLEEAYHFLGIRKLATWDISFQPIEPSAHFHEGMRRLAAFDIKSSESGKEVLIDLVLQEALNRRDRLKIWKEVKLTTPEISGRIEYVFAERIDILEAPFVCLAEAKRDDFEKGLAQCLVGMKVCQILNQQAGHTSDVFGIVTNAMAWQFYKLTSQNKVWESTPVSLLPQYSILFGLLDAVLQVCEQSLD